MVLDFELDRWSEDDVVGLDQGGLRNATWQCEQIKLKILGGRTTGLPFNHTNKKPKALPWAFCFFRSLTMTYFHTGNLHYHRR